MANHRHLGMDWQASVASVAVNAAKAQKRSETASTGAVSRLRYETEKRSYDLSGCATTEYVDEAGAATLESAEAYADGADEVVLAEAASYTDKGDEDALAEAQAYTDGAVSTAISGVYTVCGSCAYADLPEDAETGDVYNVTEDFTLDGEDYPAGTNVVWTEDGWDALAGITDLSAYATTEYVDEAVAGIETGAASILLGSTALDADVEAGDDPTEVLSMEIDAPGGTALAVLTGTAWLTATDETCLPIAGHALTELDIDGDAVGEAAITATMSTAARSEPLLLLSMDMDEGTRTAALLLRSSGDEYSTFTLGAGAGLAVYAIG